MERPHRYVIKRVTLLVVVLFHLTPKLLAQSERLYFDRVSKDLGMPNGYVTCIAQDDLGFLWVGTENGLCKFDGYTFEVFRHDPEDSTSISANGIWSVYFDSKGRLWIGTDVGGLNYYDYEKDRFYQIKPASDSLEFPIEGAIRSITEDNEGTIWFGTWGSGLHRVNRDLSSFMSYQNDAANPGSLSNNIVLSIVPEEDGELWIGTYGGGLNQYDPAKDEFAHYETELENPQSLSSMWINDLYKDADGFLWIATKDQGLNRFDPSKRTFERFQQNPDDPTSISSNNIFKVIQDQFGKFWITMVDGGLDRFNPELNLFTHYENEADNTRSLYSGRLSALFEDRTGLIWIGTSNSGLNSFDPNTKAFSETADEPALSKILSQQAILYLYKEEPSTLWVGTYSDGLYRFDTQTGKRIQFSREKSPPYYLNSNVVPAITKTPDNTLWVSTFGGGLHAVNLEKGSNQLYTAGEKSISDNNANPLAYDSKGNLWIGTAGGGLNRFDLDAGTFEHFMNDPEDPHSLSSNNINYLFVDQQDNLWIATNGQGMNRYDSEHKQFIRYFTDVKDGDHLVDNFVTYFHQDAAGNLWIGTANGFSKYNLQEDTFTNYSEQDGLTNGFVTCILEDDHGNLWLATQNGLNKFSPATEQFTTFRKGDGLQSDEFIHPVGFKDEKGKLFFGGSDGINTFYPDRIKVNSEPPAVYITEFLLNREPVKVSDQAGRKASLNKHVHLTQQISLDYDDRIFGFEFTALNFRQPNNNQFAYKLDGFDEDWISVDYENRKAVYTNISPGEYTFKVKASNNKGVWNDEGASMKLIIYPPWWKTWWAQLLLYSGIGLLGYGIFKLRISVIEQQKKKLEQEVAMRTSEVVKQKQEIESQATRLTDLNNQKNKLLSIVSHDLRSPLTSLQGIASMLDPEILTEEQLSTFRDQISDKIQGLSESMVNLLDWTKSQMEGEVIKPERVDIAGVSSKIIEFHATNAEKKKIKLSNHIQPGTEAFADINHVRVILRNLVGNAVKFTRENGQITLYAVKEENNVITSVRDTGDGMTKEKQASLFSIATNVTTKGTSGEQGVGLGLLMVKEFTEKNGGSIWVESEPDQGSIFHFSLPLKKV